MVLTDNIIPIPSFLIRSSNASISLNSANTFLGFGFQTISGFNLKKVHVYLIGVTGGPSASDIRCYIMSAQDATGFPGSSLGNAALSSNPVVGVNTFIFTPEISLSANTMYWLVLRNLNPAPSSSYVSVLRSVGVASFVTIEGPAIGALATSTDGGLTWSYQSEYVHPYVLETDTGTQYRYIPYTPANVTIPSGSFVGYRLTPPVNMQLVGARVYWYSVTANTGALFRLEVWNSTGTSMLWSSANTTAYRQGNRSAGYSPVGSFTLNAGTTYIAGIRSLSGTTSSDSIAGRLVNAGTNPLSLMNMEVAVHDGTAWSFYGDRVLGMALLSDSLSYPVSSGGGLTPGLYRGVW